MSSSSTTNTSYTRRDPYQLEVWDEAMTIKPKTHYSWEKDGRYYLQFSTIELTSCLFQSIGKRIVCFNLSISSFESFGINCIILLFYLTLGRKDLFVSGKNNRVDSLYLYYISILNQIFGPFIETPPAPLTNVEIGFENNSR